MEARTPLVHSRHPLCWQLLWRSPQAKCGVPIPITWEMRERSVMQEWTQIKGFGSVSNFRGCGPEISQRNSTPWGQAAVATDEISHGWERCYDFSTKKVCRPSISCFNIDMVINNKTDVNLGQTWNEAWKENVRCFFFFFFHFTKTRLQRACSLGQLLTNIPSLLFLLNLLAEQHLDLKKDFRMYPSMQVNPA